MRTDCFWSLCPLSPFSTSTLYCLRCKTGLLDSRRSRPTQPTCWANTPTSSPFPTFDPSLATSKGTRTERARMMAWEGTHLTQIFPHHHTPNTLLPTQCNPIILPANLTLLNNIYHPPGLGFNPYPYPMEWPMVFTLTLTPLLPPSPCLLTLRQESQHTERK
jgi:hypothetical protein